MHVRMTDCIMAQQAAWKCKRLAGAAIHGSTSQIPDHPSTERIMPEYMFMEIAGSSSQAQLAHGSLPLTEVASARCHVAPQAPTCYPGALRWHSQSQCMHPASAQVLSWGLGAAPAQS